MSSSLDKHNVRYSLLGGCPPRCNPGYRGHVCCYQPGKKSFAAAEKVMGEIGLKSRLLASAGQAITFHEEYIRNRRLVAWSFYNPMNRLEVDNILITEDACEMHTVEKKCGLPAKCGRHHSRSDPPEKAVSPPLM